MWEGSEVLEPRLVALHNLRSALESAVSSVASATLACEDAAELLVRTRRNLLTAIEETIWLDEGPDP